MNIYRLLHMYKNKIVITKNVKELLNISKAEEIVNISFPFYALTSLVLHCLPCFSFLCTILSVIGNEIKYFE